MNKINETTWTKNKPMHSLYAEQNDWNQTLHTKINECGSQLVQERKKGQEVNRKLIVPNQFKEQFETLVYYDSEKQILKGSIVIEFIDENALYDKDTIYVIENDNYCTIQLI